MASMTLAQLGWNDFFAQAFAPHLAAGCLPARVTLELKGYFEFLTTETRIRFDGGESPMEAARDIDLGPYSGWSEPERVVANVHALYRDFGSAVPGDALTLMAEMAALADGA